jgi:hypothetical protein
VTAAPSATVALREGRPGFPETMATSFLLESDARLFT